MDQLAANYTVLCVVCVCVRVRVCVCVADNYYNYTGLTASLPGAWVSQCK